MLCIAACHYDNTHRPRHVAAIMLYPNPKATLTISRISESSTQTTFQVIAGTTTFVPPS